MKSLGNQILVEFYDCNPEILKNQELVEEQMILAAKRSGATVVAKAFHSFSPHGVSGVVVIAESHVSIHTWPEYGYAAVDVFTCGDSIDPQSIHLILKESFKCRNSSSMELKRGLFQIKNELKRRV